MSAKKHNKIKAIQVRLTPEDYEKLMNHSIKIDIPMAVIARQVLKTYLSEKE